MKRVFFVIVGLLIVFSLVVPVVHAEESIQLDEFGNKVIVVPQSHLVINGIEAPFDEFGNYVVYSSDIVVITTTGEVKGSLTISGPGTWILSSSLWFEGQVTVLGGRLITQGNTIDVGSFYIGEYGNLTPILVELRSSSITCFAFAVRGSNVSLDSGTSTIITTLLFDDSAKTGRHYYNVTVLPKNSVYGFIEGKSTFNKLVFGVADTAYLVNSVSCVEVESKSIFVKSYSTISNKRSIPVVTSFKESLGIVGIVEDLGKK